MKENKATNELALESSPYLLQHAKNPVNWRIWSDAALNDAKEQNKLLVISVGYAACHWCHVMEHESFEDIEVAKIMNDNYIAIKVDREERPDIDQVYMQAVQVMTGMGGWPMNIVALPDGRPIWGGTYFKKHQWISALQQIKYLYKSEPEQLYNYAEKLENGLEQMNIIDIPTNSDFSSFNLNNCISTWQKKFDFKYGGIGNAPKFMMPNNLAFLLRYSNQNRDTGIANFVWTTLDKIASGGIFDPIDGGFSRYSVDEKWHIPHFEKMLYDNAQLLSLYSDAYKLSQKEEYKEVIKKTADFIETEFTDASGAFYTALDADSINSVGKKEEGVFYSWTKEELKTTISEEFELFCEYFNINSTGYWENGQYVLYKTTNDATFTKKHTISAKEFSAIKKTWISDLRKTREKRQKPLLDDKSLTSWNALTIIGLLDAYTALQDQTYFDLANKNAYFLKEHQINDDFSMFHSYKSEKSKIEGYLEDYAFSIAAFLRLYEVSFKESWLHLANNLTEYTLVNFYDHSQNLFNFINESQNRLISNPKEYLDNVIPSSNSVMAKNLFALSKHFPTSNFGDIAKNMFLTIASEIHKHPTGYSNWLQLYLNFSNPYFEIVISGEKAKQINQNIQKDYLPNCIFSGSTTKSELPLLTKRFEKGKTLIYSCKEGQCLQPTENSEEVLQKIKAV
ncbi:thioredoxin domain-containing protein [Zunongwangia sp.]|uniref:thioredoxin domain-containing protein n=1 Tax=Zunongwangia sp. TaxID=1965325 RepID=UPI003AA9240D